MAKKDSHGIEHVPLRGDEKVIPQERDIGNKRHEETNYIINSSIENDKVAGVR
jgi:hypothetical protein